MSSPDSHVSVPFVWNIMHQHNKANTHERYTLFYYPSDLLLDSSKWSCLCRRFVSRDDTVICLQAILEYILFTHNYICSRGEIQQYLGQFPKAGTSAQLLFLSPEISDVQDARPKEQNAIHSVVLAQPFLPTAAARYQMLKHELIIQYILARLVICSHTKKKKCVIVTPGDTYFVYTHTLLFPNILGFTENSQPMLSDQWQL